MILVTGGAGYIGSHTVLLLLQADYEVLVLDNLSNSSEESLRRVQTLCGKAAQFIKGDIRDRALLDRLFAEHSIEAVINFAGLKAVGESVEKPLLYYQVNVHGAATLLEAMRKPLFSAPPPRFTVNRSKCRLARLARPVARPILTDAASS